MKVNQPAFIKKIIWRKKISGTEISRIEIKVIPSAKKNMVQIFGKGLKIHLQSPPLDGKANKALIAYLSKILGVKKNSIEIISGEKNRNKLLEIKGLAAEEILKTIKEMSN